MACAKHVGLQLRRWLESHLQPDGAARERVVLIMQATASFTKLQRDIHDALRAQHPEWVQPDGDCPTCDSYETRFAELLRPFLSDGSSRKERKETL